MPLVEARRVVGDEIFMRWGTELFPFLVAALLAGLVAAQEPLDCERLLLSYSEAAIPQESMLHLNTAGGGRLFYFGALHSTDPQHPQFAAIERSWAQLRPTIAFYEGPDRDIADGAEQTVHQTGESGYVRWLARRDGAALGRLEPDPRAEAEYVLAEFPREQVELFYLLRETSRLRERGGLGEPQLKAAAAQLLQRASSLGLITELSSEAAIQAAYQRHFQSPAQWWQAPAAWFTPNPQDAERSGGGFMHLINHRSSQFRDLHMFRVLTEAVREGHRVFAVVGRNHVDMQAPALRCALQGDRQSGDRF
jgi:hypothetical protein